MTGMREQEVMHAYWSDVSFSHATVPVTHKPDRGWMPKAYKEREILSVTTAWSDPYPLGSRWQAACHHLFSRSYAICRPRRTISATTRPNGNPVEPNMTRLQHGSICRRSALASESSRGEECSAGAPLGRRRRSRSLEKIASRLMCRPSSRMTPIRLCPSTI